MAHFVSMAQLAGLIGLGLVAGIFSGFFGIGGGIVIVPGLAFLLGYSQTAATGTSLTALLLPVGILGVWEYYRSGKIGPPELRAGLIVAIGIFLGAYVGARIAVGLPEAWLRRGFALFLVAIAARLWLQK